MRKQLLLALMFLIGLSATAQTFNYQGVARDNLGDIIPNQNIGLQMSVRQGGATGTIIYQEAHTATTNEFGLFGASIGSGTPSIGTFNTIDWSSMDHWIEVGVDFSGGTTYVSLGATEFQAVPYAMYAASSPQDGTGTDDQNITGSSITGNNLTIGIEGGNPQTVDISSVRSGLIAQGANNVQPYTTVNYIIALNGIFPSQSLTGENQTSSSTSQPFIGSIVMFAGTFAPRDWAFCDGQLLSIAQNTALFSIIGCQYGGDCQSTFALPDLRSRVPVHEGQGPGLTNRPLASQGGTETVN